MRGSGEEEPRKAKETQGEKTHPRNYSLTIRASLSTTEREL